MSKLNILITNDDGIHAKGLKELAQVAQNFGNVLIVAPSGARSGMSSAITVEHPVRLKLHEERDDYKAYSCTGTPVDCVKIAFDQLLDTPPDLILSGINHGANSSISVHYSGTMGAAMEGCIHEVPSIGFSLCDYHPDADFNPAIPYVKAIIEQTLNHGLPRGTCLNVNIPKGQPLGLEICRQGHGRWFEEFEKRIDPHHQPYYWITGHFKNMENGNTDTDNHFLSEMKVSVVPIKIDMTDHDFLQKMKIWNFNNL